MCAGISLRQSRSYRQLVYASFPWVVDGRGLVLVPLSFLVLVECDIVICFEDFK